MKEMSNLLRRITKLWSFFIIIFGLILIFIALKIKPDDLSIVDDWSRLFYNFFELTGFTLFCSGIFSFFLQLPDWRDYFENRLKSIVLEQNYLNLFNKDALDDLLDKTFNAYCRTNDIYGEGSFLHYFHNNLKENIHKPYRYDVRSEIVILEKEKDAFWVSDRITYNCKMIGGKIQEDLKWVPEPEEFLEIENIEMSLKRKNESKIKVLELYKENGEYKKKSILSGENNKYEITDISMDDINKQGLNFPLKHFNEDGLNVEIKAKYKMESWKFISWTMAHLTKSFNITVSYPVNWKIKFQPYFKNLKKAIIENEKGFLSMKYDEWLLPFSGVGAVVSFAENNKGETHG